MNRRRAAFLFACAISLVVLASSLFAAPKLKVGFVAIDMSADSINTAYKGLKEYADKQGWQVNLADCQGVVAKMSGFMINMVDWGAKAIVVSGGEASFIEEGVSAADKAKVPVFLEDTENTGNTIVNATTNGWEMGARLASEAVNKMRIYKPNKKVHNVLIISNKDLFVHRQRVQMYKAVLTSPDNPDMRVVGDEAINPADWANSSYDIAKTYITKYGDDLDAILATWDGLCWGISRAIQDAGFSRQQIFTMGIDGSPKTYDLIRNGDPMVGVVAQDFFGWSRGIGSAIDKMVVEKMDPKRFIPASKTIFIPYKWIDETNVPAAGQSFKSNYAGLD